MNNVHSILSSQLCSASVDSYLWLPFWRQSISHLGFSSSAAFYFSWHYCLSKEPGLLMMCLKLQFYHATFSNVSGLIALGSIPSSFWSRVFIELSPNTIFQISHFFFTISLFTVHFSYLYKIIGN